MDHRILEAAMQNDAMGLGEGGAFGGDMPFLTEGAWVQKNAGSIERPFLATRPGTLP